MTIHMKPVTLLLMAYGTWTEVAARLDLDVRWVNKFPRRGGDLPAGLIDSLLQHSPAPWLTREMLVNGAMVSIAPADAPAMAAE